MSIDRAVLFVCRQHELSPIRLFTGRLFNKGRRASARLVSRVPCRERAPSNGHDERRQSTDRIQLRRRANDDDRSIDDER
jgi:hypothetical protein